VARPHRDSGNIRSEYPSWLTQYPDRGLFLQPVYLVSAYANTVRNLDVWYPAFDVQPGDRLYLTPEERVRLW